MKPLKEWTEADLLQLIADGAEEAQDLEFKAGPALAKTDEAKTEMAKDVSGMANASGGLIIYGISEKKDGVANKLIGADPALSVDWINQVLDSGVAPRLHGVDIRKLPLSDGSAAFLIEVPQAVYQAPHQAAKLGRYFRRYGREVLVMLDHEIRDVMRRGHSPELELTLTLGAEAGDEFALSAFLSNLSGEPALYTTIDICLERAHGLPVKIPDWDMRAWRLGPDENHHAVRYIRNWMVPERPPLMRGRDSRVMRVGVTIEPNKVYFFEYGMTCPGFDKRFQGEIMRLGDDKPTITERLVEG